MRSLLPIAVAATVFAPLLPVPASAQQPARQQTTSQAVSQTSGSQLERAEGALRSSDYGTARRLFEAEAQRGVSAAQWGLARVLLDGLGGPSDRVRGLAALERAAQAGIGPANLRLARELLSSNDGASKVRGALLLDGLAQAGSVDAAASLETLYAGGFGGVLPPTREVEILRSAAVHSTRAALLLAYRLTSSNLSEAERQEGLRLLLGAAVAGDSEAASVLRQELFSRGTDIPELVAFAARNLTRSDIEQLANCRGSDQPGWTRALLEAAAEAGASHAAIALARLYSGECGYPRDADSARHWVRAAVDRDLSALGLMAAEILESLGTATDLEMREILLARRGRILDSDGTDALIFLAHSLLTPRPGETEPASERVTRAYEVIVEAAERGEPIANGYLAHFFAHGLIVSQDNAEALRQIRTAQQRGLASTLYVRTLCIVRSQRNTPEFDREEALGACREAAVFDEEAVIVLLSLFERSDPDYAREVERLAAVSVSAQINLGWLLYTGEHIIPDRPRAFQLMRRAAEAGHPYAKNNLGVMYSEGLAAPIDVNRAIQLFRQALAGQVHYAAANLIRAIYWRQTEGTSEDVAGLASMHRQWARQDQLSGAILLSRLVESGGVPSTPLDGWNRLLELLLAGDAQAALELAEGIQPVNRALRERIVLLTSIASRLDNSKTLNDQLVSYAARMRSGLPPADLARLDAAAAAWIASSSPRDVPLPPSPPVMRASPR